MYKYIYNNFLNGHRYVELGKLLIIAIFSVLSLFISIFFLFINPHPNFLFVYVFIPHMYLIPIILLALWFPKSGLRLVIIILFLLTIFWICTIFFGYSFPPLFIILYTGLDLATFVVFLLYVKDRRLVEAVISDLLIRSSRVSNTFPSKKSYEQNFDDIISKLEDQDEEVREEAINALIEIDDERIVLPLISKLHDTSAMVRRAAADALGKTRTIKAVRPLIQALSDNERIVRETAAESLGHLGSIANNDLVAMGTSQDWRVRSGILIAFRVSKEQTPSSLDVVRNLIIDPNVYVRREATKTLGRIGDHNDLSFFIQALRDSDPGVRTRAIRAISRVGTTYEKSKLLNDFQLDPDSMVRIATEEALNQMDLKKE